MLIDRIDHVVVPVASLEAASAPFERLGLKLTPPMRHAGGGTENRVFFVGAGENHVYVELLGVNDRAVAPASYTEAIDRGGGTLTSLVLAVNDMFAAIEELGRHGIHTSARRVLREDGTPIGDIAPIDGVAALGFSVVLIQYVEPRPEQSARRAASGVFSHAFPLKRLDHLAAMAPDLEASTRFWVDVLGVPVHGEVRGPGIIIRQFKMGDVILELLGPDGPDSRLAGRPPGISSMCAFEVPDLESAVALARERGFTVPDPNKGILPGTRTASIPGTELGGLTLQLLEYV
jgi:catechol 2,3-dioxygenase-like lactoylglutathione lyase family enzyme